MIILFCLTKNERKTKENMGHILWLLSSPEFSLKWCVIISYSVRIKIWGGSIIDAIQVDEDFYGTDNPNPANLNEITLALNDRVRMVEYSEYIGSVTSLQVFRTEFNRSKIPKN